VNAKTSLVLGLKLADTFHMQCTCVSDERDIEEDQSLTIKNLKQATTNPVIK